jgi:hypothetical protein
MNDWIDVYVVSFVGLSNHLVMYLRTGRHIDNHVCLKGCLAAQPTVIWQSAPLPESLFGITRRRKVCSFRDNVVLCEFAFRYKDLAPATNGPTATN